MSPKRGNKSLPGYKCVPFCIWHVRDSYFQFLSKSVHDEALNFIPEVPNIRLVYKLVHSDCSMWPVGNYSCSVGNDVAPGRHFIGYQSRDSHVTMLEVTCNQTGRNPAPKCGPDVRFVTWRVRRVPYSLEYIFTLSCGLHKAIRHDRQPWRRRTDNIDDNFHLQKVKLPIMAQRIKKIGFSWWGHVSCINDHP
jgi:hypothetical protein